MAREAAKLTARTVQSAREPGRYADGGGLYLHVGPTGSRSWLFMWKTDGRRREMGLGPVRDVPLARARELAEEARRTVRAGRDPIRERDQAAKAAEAALARAKTFGEAADALLDDVSEGWRNDKHRKQWRMTLTTYCASIRDKAVAEITTEDVLSVLKPLWTRVPETASRLRGRMERVLSYAKVKGWRTGENPALWRGHLALMLPKRQKLTRGHHKAMPFEDVPGFIAKLRETEGISARALEFAILTAARSGEVLGARWIEIDLDARVWTVPAGRMKAGREHRVPLCDRAVEIIGAMSENRTSDFVFPGMRPQKPLSIMALEMVMRRAEADSTVHGFRSSFRDWCGERTTYPREIAEAALAHLVGNEVERAYRRGDALEKRRKLMSAWGAFCEPMIGANVVAITASRSSSVERQQGVRGRAGP